MARKGDRKGNRWGLAYRGAFFLIEGGGETAIYSGM